MKKLLASTAIVAMVGLPASAQTTSETPERSEMTEEVDRDATGLTTQSGPELQTVEDAEDPTLDDGTVVSNPQTPATVRIIDGEVEADSDGAPAPTD